MGGCGALISAIKYPGNFRSVSAFAPVANPSQTPDIQRVLRCFFGNDIKAMQEWDPTCLIYDYKGPELNILIHQVNYIKIMLLIVFLVILICCILIFYLYRELMIYTKTI